MTVDTLEAVKRAGTGLAFIVFPIIFVFAFAIHPNLFSLTVVTDVETRISEFHGNRLMHLGHALMLLAAPLLIVVSLEFMHMLSKRSAWARLCGLRHGSVWGRNARRGQDSTVPGS